MDHWVGADGLVIVEKHHARYVCGMRVVGLVQLSMVTWFSGCAAHSPYHFRDTPEDYARLGLTNTIVPKEDARHTQTGTDDYEWWYLDGLGKDGTVVVVVFSDNWLPGSHARTVTIDVTPRGKPTMHGVFSSAEPGVFSREHADVQIGGSRFEGDLNHYSIRVSPSDLKGLGCDLQLERHVPSFRPGTGVLGSDDDFFAWVVAVPEGGLSGSLTIDGQRVEFTGSGYHDHNWGNVAPWALMRNWWWGRGEVGGRTVVMSEMRPAAGRGDKPMALLYVAGPDGVLVDAHGEGAHLVEGSPSHNDDSSHVEAQPAKVTLETNAQGSSTFARHGAPLTSVDLVSFESDFVRFLAKMVGRTPWYTRWSSAVTIDATGSQTHGEGTIEFMDFE